MLPLDFPASDYRTEASIVQHAFLVSKRLHFGRSSIRLSSAANISRFEFGTAAKLAGHQSVNQFGIFEVFT